MRRSAWQRTISDANGVPVSGVQINVFLNDGITPATIASSAAGAALTNPFVTSTAVAKFFALPGLYVVKATKGGQTQTFSDIEIGARNYREDQGALGGSARDVADITADTTIVSEGGAFRFLTTAVGRPSFAENGLVFAAPYDGTPSSVMIGSGLRANGSRVAFMGRRNAAGSTPQWSELWDKALNPPQAFATDLTAGALLNPGSFGLGGTNSVDFAALGITLDSFSAPSGLFRARAVDTGNKPAGLTDFCFLNMRFNASDQTRLAIGLSGEAWTYASAGGTWGVSGYRRQYDNINAVSAVGFSGGISTGGLMEYGTNANGVYYKHADGRLECIFARTVSMSANTDDVYTWTFPATFINPPNQITTAIGGANVTNIFNVNKAAIASTGLTSAVMRTQVSVAQSHTLSYCAVGRWR